MLTATKIFRFCACHRLEDTQSDKCKNLHGHSYKVEITIGAKELNKDQMVIDFGVLKKIVQPLVDEFDHSELNFWENNPTAEWLCINFKNMIESELKNYPFEENNWLQKVRVWEEIDSCHAEWRKD